VQSILESTKHQEPTAPTCAAVGSPVQTQFFSIEFLRFYATLQVLLIHSAGIFAYAMTSKSTWWAGCLIDSFSRPAVPIFFMISGMLLLASTANKEEKSITLFLKRRFSKIFLPLLVWTIIYLCSRWINVSGSFDWHLLPQYLSQPACYHLGFLYQLGGLYLITPILRVLTANGDRIIIKYFVTLWFISQCIVPELLFYTGWSPPVYFQMLSGSVGLFLLGYLLRDYKFQKRTIPLALIAIALCIAGISIGTFFLTNGAPNKIINERFFEYHHPLVIIYAVLTFVLLRSITFKLPPNMERITRKSVSSFASASFSIYLVHPLYLEAIQSHTTKLLNAPGNKFILCFVEIWLTATIAALIGWLFYAASRTLKLPKWLVP